MHVYGIIYMIDKTWEFDVAIQNKEEKKHVLDQVVSGVRIWLSVRYFQK